MILAVDIGNTETVLGLFDDVELHRLWRLSTVRERTADELALILDGLLTREGRGRPGHLIAASVVPALDRVWTGAAERLGVELAFLNGASALPIRLDVDHPLEVGADRIANTLAVSQRFGRDAIVVDLGTATTCDCVTREGVFIGGTIAPGPLTALEHLTRRTAKLPQVEMAKPARVIGRNTLDCVRSGGFYAVVDGIDGMVRRIRREWEVEEPLVVATGGLAELIGRHCETVERIEPALTLVGLAIAHRLSSEG